MVFSSMGKQFQGLQGAEKGKGATKYFSSIRLIILMFMYQDNLEYFAGIKS